MKFPVFSLLAGNLAFSETSSRSDPVQEYLAPIQLLAPRRSEFRLPAI